MGTIVPLLVLATATIVIVTVLAVAWRAKPETAPGDTVPECWRSNGNGTASSCNAADLSQLHQSFAGTGLLMGGEFEFLGAADKGESLFDASPPPGVVKVYYLGPMGTLDFTKTSGGVPNRCGFFRCPRHRWSAFKKANARWNSHTSWGKYDCTGDYPIARTVVVPSIPEAQTAQMCATKAITWND